MLYKEESYENDPAKAHSADAACSARTPSLNGNLMHERNDGSNASAADLYQEQGSRVAELERLNSWLSSRVRDYEEQLKEGEETNRLLLKDNEQLRSAKKGLEAQVTAAEAELSKVQASQEESSNSCRMLKSQHDQIKEDLDAMRNDLASLSSDREFYEKELDKSSLLNARQSKELQELKDFLEESKATAALCKAQYEENESAYLKETERLQQELRILNDNSISKSSCWSSEGENLADALSQDDSLKVHHHKPLMGQGEGATDARPCAACDRLKRRLEKRDAAIADLRAKLEMLQVEKSIVLSQKEAVIERLEAEISALQVHLAELSYNGDSENTMGDLRRSQIGAQEIVYSNGTCLPLQTEGVLVVAGESAEVCRSIVRELTDAVCLVCSVTEKIKGSLSVMPSGGGGEPLDVLQVAARGPRGTNEQLFELLLGLRGGVNSIQGSISTIVSLMESTTSRTSPTVVSQDTDEAASGGLSVASSCPVDIASETSSRRSEPFSSNFSGCLGSLLLPFSPEATSRSSAAASRACAFPLGREFGTFSSTAGLLDRAEGNYSVTNVQANAMGGTPTSFPEQQLPLLPSEWSRLTRARADGRFGEESAESVAAAVGAQATGEQQRCSGRTGERPTCIASLQLSECSLSSAGASTDACAAVLDERVQQIGSMFETRLNNFTTEVDAQVNKIKIDLETMSAKYDELLRPTKAQAPAEIRHDTALNLRYGVATIPTQKFAQQDPSALERRRVDNDHSKVATGKIRRLSLVSHAAVSHTGRGLKRDYLPTSKFSSKGSKASTKSQSQSQ